MYDQYESPLSSRYASSYMLRLFSAQTRIQTWRRLWTELARAEMELGLPITASQVKALEDHIEDIDFALAAARESDLANPFKESSGSQFYLVQDPEHCKHLDGEYTVFGETVAGLHVIDAIAGTQTDRLDRPVREVRILSIKPNKELNSKEFGTEIAINKTE